MGQLPLGGTDVSGGMDTMLASPSTKYVCSSVWLLLFEMQMIDHPNYSCRMDSCVEWRKIVNGLLQ